MELEPESLTSSSSTFSSNLSCRGLGAHFEERCLVYHLVGTRTQAPGLPQTSGVPSAECSCCMTATQLPPGASSVVPSLPHTPQTSAPPASWNFPYGESRYKPRRLQGSCPQCFSTSVSCPKESALSGTQIQVYRNVIDNTDTLGWSDFPEHFSSVRRAVSGISALSPDVVQGLF